MASFDHRLDTRVPTDFPVIMRTPLGNEVLRVTNLSFGGMRVSKGKTVLGQRDEVDLRFRLPSGAGSIVCGAEVVYDSGKSLGIQFNGLSILQMRVLDKFLAELIGENWFS